MNAESSASSAGRFAGDLCALPLVDLIQMLMHTQRTGRLRIDAPSMDGEIHVRKGQVVRVAANDEVGLAALKGLALLESGAFQFELGEFDPRVDVSASTDQLLLELCRFIDDRDHASAIVEGFRDSVGGLASGLLSRRSGVLLRRQSAAFEIDPQFLLALRDSHMCTNDLMKSLLATRSTMVVYEDDLRTICMYPVRRGFSLWCAWPRGRMPERVMSAMVAASEQLEEAVVQFE